MGGVHRRKHTLKTSWFFFPKPRFGGRGCFALLFFSMYVYMLGPCVCFQGWVTSAVLVFSLVVSTTELEHVYVLLLVLLLFFGFFFSVMGSLCCYFY